LRDDTAVTAATGGPRTAGLRTRLDTFRATRRRGAVGLPEFVALAVAALLLMTAVLAYLFLLVPQRSRLASLEAERADLQRLVASQQTNIGESRNTQQRVSEILSSLGRFEVDHLGLSGSGTKTVIEELNRLIIKDGLRISGGVQFTQLQEVAPAADEQKRRNTSEETAQRVVQSVFPGIGVTLTVEGTYPNLRRFIRDIEADRQFVVINAVELEGVTDSNAAQQTAPQPVAPPAGAVAPETPGAQVQPQVQTPSRGALVSLRLDMAAYFRRASAPAEQ
jgi:Tfp pilus assembly protein PilO